MKRLISRAAFLALAWIVSSAHVGSPDTWFEGLAGPYHVTVRIVPAGVVPGVARIYVRATGHIPAEVTIQADKFDATGGSPPPEPATRVAGDDGFFEGKLWIMSPGSNSVTVNVSGPQGSGKVVVPVVTVPYSRLMLGRGMGVGLAAMGVFLFVTLVTIIGAAVREGSVNPGESPTPRKMRRARTAVAMTSVLLAAALFGGWKWWTAEDASFVRSMYKPLDANARVTNTGDGRMVSISIADSAWQHRNDRGWLQRRNANSWTPLIEDHGKLMHMFLIRDDMAAFAHLHPATSDTVTFIAPLPAIPEGTYRVFADIVHESGFTHTLVTSVDVPAGGRMPLARASPDDSWSAEPVSAGSTRVSMTDGTTVEWKRGRAALVAGRPAALTFEVRNPDRSPANLQPYMGMAGHAVVHRADGTVFVHLHPMGTISMASQLAFQMRQPGDTVRGALGKRLAHAEMAAMKDASVISNIVSFPYAFPRAGNYRIWVQVKRNGRILTAAFDASVAEEPTAN